MNNDHTHAGDPSRRRILHALWLLRRISAAVNDWHRTTTEEGVTFNQGLALHYLVRHGDATPSDLADWMHVTRGTVTPTIQRLEDLGLLTRRPDENDGRKQWLTATPEAHELAPEVEETVLHPVLKELRSWPSQELTRFIESMERLLAGSVFGEDS